MNEANRKEARACFRDEAQFERLGSGEDYRNGLADVTDEEFNAHYERMVTALHSLADSSRVQAGVVVYLETVPTLFLREAPLVNGKWLDRHVAEMAEWSAMLSARSYRLQETGDGHPLAPAARSK